MMFPFKVYKIDANKIEISQDNIETKKRFKTILDFEKVEWEEHFHYLTSKGEIRYNIVLKINDCDIKFEDIN